MANTYKNIVITPSIGSNSADPKIVFSGANTNTNTDITVFVYPTANGTLSFEGSVGQLFSVTNDLSNNIFRAADVSGTPLIDAFANGLVSLVPTSGNVGIANTTPAHKLSVNGTGYFVGNVTVGNSSVNASVFSNSSGVYFGGTSLTANNANNLNGKAEAALNVNNATYLGSTVNSGNSSGFFSTSNIWSGLGTDGQILLTDTVNGGIELGKTGRTSSGTPYIDFHSSASSPDYDVRVMASSGNSTAGSGAITIFHGGANTFFAANGNVGIANSSPAHKFSVNGTGYFGSPVYIGATPASGVQLYLGGNYPSTTDAYGLLTDQTVPSTATSSATAVLSNPSTAAAAFTLPSLNHFVATQGTIGAGSTVTNQRGFYAFNTLTGATNNYGFYSDIAFGSNRWNFYASGTAYNFFQGAVGFGNGPTAYTQQRIGGTGPSSSSLTYSVYADQTAPATTTSEFASFYSIPNTTASAFTLGTLFHFVSNQGTIGAGSAVTNQFGFYAASNMTGATNNYGFYSNIAAGTGRWNFFSNGTADNYFAGSVGIGSTPATNIKLQISGTAPSSGATSYSVYNSTTVPSTTTAGAGYFTTTASTQAASFTLTNLQHFFASQGTFGAGSTVTNQYGFYISSNLTGATNNYGVYSDIAAAAGRYNFYAAGTANNLFNGVTTFANSVQFSTLTGLVKGNGASVATAASAGTDYMAPGTTSTITVGYSVTPYNGGTPSAASTYTPAPANGNYQYLTNNAAFTLAAPSADCAIDILVTNGASAGAITLSGFTAPTGGGGDTYATTNALKFILMIRRINGTSTYSWKALQ